MQQQAVALIADPDQKFLEKLCIDSLELLTQPVVVSTHQDLQNKLQDPTELYSGIFINPKLADPMGVPLVKVIRQQYPTVPIFFILDDAQPFLAEQELSKLTICNSFKKPLSFQDIQQALKQGSKVFDAQGALALANEVEVVDIEFEDSDESFSSIRARGLVGGSTSYFDIYVRLNPKKYIKILSAGDAFSDVRIQSYLNKGVETFYLRKKAQESYLKYCDVLSTAILSMQSVAPSVKVAHTLNWGEETAVFLRAGGFNAGAIHYAQSYARKVHALTKEIKLDTCDAIKNYLQNNANFDHSVAILMVASLLAIPLRFSSERSTGIIGLTALLHDIGMARLDKNLQNKEESAMTKEEFAVYKTHPLIGQAILKDVHGIEPIVHQAVAQHHERRTGRGFPLQLNGSGINLVAEIIGISEELVKQMEQVIADPNLNLIKEMEKKSFDGFSSSVIATLNMFIK